MQPSSESQMTMNAPTESSGGSASGLEAILFDLDGTLLDRRTAFRSQLEHGIRRQSVMYGPAATRRYLARLVDLDEAEIGTPDFYPQVESSLGLAPGTARALTEDIELRPARYGRPAPLVKECLGALRSMGLKLGLVVNGDPRLQARRIARLGLAEFFDSVVISGQVGVRKPDPRIFHYCLAELEADPAASAYVGDHPEADVRGASRAGLIAIWRRDPFWSEPAEADAVVDDLEELLAWAGRHSRPVAGAN